MPARVIDGDAIWGSDKLFHLSEEARVDYVWLYPLADAHGIFELTNLVVVHAKVAALRPSLTVAKLGERFRQYNDVGLLFIWIQGCKTFGYWVGADKKGRLPKPSDRKKFKNCEADCPVTGLQEYVAKFQGAIKGREEGEAIAHGMGMGMGMGMGLGEGLGNGNDDVNKTQLKKEISVACIQILNMEPEEHKDTWAKASLLSDAYKGSTLVQAFRDWAAANKGDQFYGKPLAAFLKTAQATLEANKTVGGNSDSQLNELCAELYTTGGQVFAGKNRTALIDLLPEYPIEDIVAAYKEFVDGKEKEDLRYAPKNFAEGGAVAILIARQKRAVEELRQRGQVDAILQSQAAIAEQELAAFRQQQSEEQALIEEEL